MPFTVETENAKYGNPMAVSTSYINELRRDTECSCCYFCGPMSGKCWSHDFGDSKALAEAAAAAAGGTPARAHPGNMQACCNTPLRAEAHVARAHVECDMQHYVSAAPPVGAGPLTRTLQCAETVHTNEGVFGCMFGGEWASPPTVSRSRVRRRGILHAWVNAMKTFSGGCKSCGVTVRLLSALEKMELDHFQGEKVMKVAQMVNREKADLIPAELRKTSCLCTNCHRAKSQGFFRPAKLDAIATSQRAIIANDNDELVANALLRYLDREVWPMANSGDLQLEDGRYSICSMTYMALSFLKHYDDALFARGALENRVYERAFGRGDVAATVPQVPVMPPPTRFTTE